MPGLGLHSDDGVARIDAETLNYIDSVMAEDGCICGATGLVMERGSLGIAATWYLVLPPLWLFGMDGGVWFCSRTDYCEVGGFAESLRFAEDVSFLRKF